MIDLADNVVRGGGTTGWVGGVENVSADYYRGPVIRGDELPNELHGRRLYGRGGDDTLWGRFVDGGRGIDKCRAETEQRCEIELEVD
jgi:hypothetical protein